MKRTVCSNPHPFNCPTKYFRLCSIAWRFKMPVYFSATIWSQLFMPFVEMRPMINTTLGMKKKTLRLSGMNIKSRHGMWWRIKSLPSIPATPPISIPFYPSPYSFHPLSIYLVTKYWSKVAHFKCTLPFYISSLLLIVIYDSYLPLIFLSSQPACGVQFEELSWRLRKREVDCVRASNLGHWFMEWFMLSLTSWSQNGEVGDKGNVLEVVNGGIIIE